MSMDIRNGRNTQEEQDGENGVLAPLKEYRNQIVVLTLGVLAYGALTGGFGFIEDIPQVYIDSLRYAVVSFVFVYIFGDAILDKIQDFKSNLLLELNLVTAQNPPRLFKLGDEVYNSMTVDGKLYKTPVIDVCVSYDKEENHAKGVWIAELADLEILRFQSSLKEAREKLQKEALEGMAKQAVAKTAAIMAQKHLIEVIVTALAEETTLDSAEINKVVDDTVKEANLTNIADEVAEDVKDKEEMTEEVQQQHIEEAQELAEEVPEVGNTGE